MFHLNIYVTNIEVIRQNVLGRTRVIAIRVCNDLKDKIFHVLLNLNWLSYVA